MAPCCVGRLPARLPDLLHDLLPDLLSDLLGRVFTHAGIEHRFAGPASMLGIHFTPTVPETYRDWRKTNSSLYQAFCWQLIDRGLMLEPDSREPWFFCEAHQYMDFGWLEDVATQSMAACINRRLST